MTVGYGPVHQSPLEGIFNQLNILNSLVAIGLPVLCTAQTPEVPVTSPDIT